MGKRTRRHTGTFTATDERGRDYTIFIFVEFEKTDFYGGSSADEGMSTLVTSDGSHVNQISKGIYEIIGTGGVIPVVSADPAAP